MRVPGLGPDFGADAETVNKRQLKYVVELPAYRIAIVIRQTVYGEVGEIPDHWPEPLLIIEASTRDKQFTKSEWEQYRDAVDATFKKFETIFPEQAAKKQTNYGASGEAGEAD